MKTVQLSILDSVRIASPCSMDWNAMTGDERTRHCDDCRLPVHNLSGLTRAEAEAFLQSIRQHAQPERVCVGFYRRPDGTILTRDCPVGLAAARARIVRAYGRIAAMLALLLGGAAALGGMHRPDRSRARLAETTHISRLMELLGSKTQPMLMQQQMILGDVCIPPMPSALPTAAPQQPAVPN